MDVKNSVHRMLLESLVLCTDAGYSPDAAAGDPAGDPADVPTGDPTEVALLEAGFRFGINKEELLQKWPRVYEVPFDSVRKRMSTVHRNSQGTRRVFTKGAPGRVLELCKSVYTSDGIVPLTPKLKREIERSVECMSGDALRVLGAAFREGVPDEEVEKELVFLGCVGMIDPPRLEVKDSITMCTRAGVRTVMITGDHRHTAFAIARELGIAGDHSEVIDGSELDTLSDEELCARLNHLRVFTRVSPEHKVRIVRALKAKGYIVSMTGDGVNDAPSLKAADIGVAMGRSGTDVAKSAADMILTDDNFQTIVSAVEEGRNIFRNIKKAIVFLLSSNTGEFISVFTAILLGWPPLLLPIHILWVNLVTDTLPALSLGVDPGGSDVLEEPPREPDESLFARGAGANIIANGLLIGILTLMAFRIGLRLSGGSILHARTVAFAVLAISQLFHAFNLRHTSKSLFQVGIFGNRALVGSFLICCLLQFVVIGLPQAARVFKVQSLGAGDWALVAGISFLPILFNEIAKGFARTLSLKKRGKGDGL
jgi:Ca2+-transporting ATPase